ncbi:hypothetical protein RJ641_019408 [Dillenia turbinata]|uniref:Uncharacterized protein n=1 Tax=Dillenia turbinata TaxID=194707 RepID=A0AAN8YXI2_9MAGN
MAGGNVDGIYFPCCISHHLDLVLQLNLPVVSSVFVNSLFICTIHGKLLYVLNLKHKDTWEMCTQETGLGAYVKCYVETRLLVEVVARPATDNQGRGYFVNASQYWFPSLSLYPLKKET